MLVDKAKLANGLADWMNLTREKLLTLAGGILIGLGVGAVVLFLIFNRVNFGNAGSVDNSIRPAVPEVGESAPDFKLVDLNGQNFNLAANKGKPILINFWATWCGPCRLEMSLLQEFQQTYDNGLLIVAVNVGESQEDVRAFAEEMNLDIKLLLDQKSEVESLYRVRGLPSTYFIDETGEIRFLHIGILTDGQLRGYIEEMGVMQ